MLLVSGIDFHFAMLNLLNVFYSVKYVVLLLKIAFVPYYFFFTTLHLSIKLIRISDIRLIHASLIHS